MMYAIIRLKGNSKLTRPIIDTFKMLRINRKHHCVILSGKDSEMGMVKKIKDYITWGEISDEVLLKLVAKRGRNIGNLRLNEEEVAKAVEEVKAGKIESIKPVFRLTPPSKGFKKSIKQQYPRGELGKRGEKINELLLRMM